MKKSESYKKASSKMSECKEKLQEAMVKLAQAENAVVEVKKEILEETEPVYKAITKAYIEAAGLEQMYKAMARVHEIKEEQE